MRRGIKIFSSKAEGIRSCEKACGGNECEQDIKPLPLGDLIRPSADGRGSYPPDPVSVLFPDIYGHIIIPLSDLSDNFGTGLFKFAKGICNPFHKYKYADDDLKILLF